MGASIGDPGNSPIRGVWNRIPPLYRPYTPALGTFREFPKKHPLAISIFSATCPPFSSFSGYRGGIQGIIMEYRVLPYLGAFRGFQRGLQAFTIGGQLNIYLFQGLYREARGVYRLFKGVYAYKQGYRGYRDTLQGREGGIGKEGRKLGERVGKGREEGGGKEGRKWLLSGSAGFTPPPLQCPQALQPKNNLT